MTKKKLYFSNAEDKRSFLEKLTVAYAPIDDLVMRRAREISKETTEQSDMPDHKHDHAVNFVVKHLGSI